VSEAIQLLKEKGFKHTDKRQEMLELFSVSDKYLTAKDVLDGLKTNYPGLSFDTIYRNLSLFADLGILETTELSVEKHFRFTCGGTHHDNQFIYLECGNTKEIESCPMDKIVDTLAGYDVTGHKFEIYGSCPECRI